MHKGLRGCWRNTPSYLSLISEGNFRSRTLKVNILHASVIYERLVFGEVIGKVFRSLLPVEAELFLLGATPHTGEAHVKLFGAFPAHVDGEDAVGGFDTSLDRSGRSRMAHLNEGFADENSLLAVVEDCTSFSLGSG